MVGPRRTRPQAFIQEHYVPLAYPYERINNTLLPAEFYRNDDIVRIAYYGGTYNPREPKYLRDLPCISSEAYGVLSHIGKRRHKPPQWVMDEVTAVKEAVLERKIALGHRPMGPYRVTMRATPDPYYAGTGTPRPLTRRGAGGSVGPPIEPPEERNHFSDQPRQPRKKQERRRKRTPQAVEDTGGDITLRALDANGIAACHRF